MRVAKPNRPNILLGGEEAGEGKIQKLGGRDGICLIVY